MTDIQYNGATITIRRGTVRSRLDCNMIFRAFDIDDEMPLAEFSRIERYARFLTQCTIVGEVGFPIPALSASEAELKAGFEAFLEADTEFYDAVMVALANADSDLNAPELLPHVQKKGSAKASDDDETSNG